MSEQSIGGTDLVGQNGCDTDEPESSEGGFVAVQGEGGDSQPTSGPRYAEDFLVASGAGKGAALAQLEIVRRIHELPIRSMLAPLAGALIDPDDVRSAMIQRIYAAPLFLLNYRGDAPLNGYMLRGATRVQLGIRRRLERQAAILLKAVYADPHLTARFKAISEEVEVVARSQNDLLIRDLVHSALYDQYFYRQGAGAPIQMPTACDQGFLETVQIIAEMHIEMLGCLKSGLDARSACAEFRRVQKYADNDVFLTLINVYAENGVVTQVLVEYGVECIIDLIDAIEEKQSQSKSRWTRRYKANLEQLGQCRKRLGQSLMRRAA